jgi:uncharacterized protein DUF4199
MKKTVLVFGVISGVIGSVLMLANVSFIDQIGFDRGIIVGYTAIVVSFLLVFFGIRSYRDNANGGFISFGKAFSVGILITIISCVFYVVTWEIAYYTVFSDFGDKWVNHEVERVRNSAAPPAEVAAQVEQLRAFGESFKNPLVNAAYTFLEPLPVGLLMTLISAAILRRKRKDDDLAEALPSTS